METTQVNKEELLQFIAKAHRNTYAAPKEVRRLHRCEQPILAGHKDYDFKEGDWEYHDSYAGQDWAPGREVVFLKGKPVWAMTYQGKHNESYPSEFFQNQAFSFLRNALRNISDEMPFRGPESFKEGDLIRVDIHYTVPPSGRKIDPSQPVEQTADVSGTEIPGSLTENYEITDVLPSGLTPVTSSMSTGYYHETKGCVDYPNQVIDQRVSFVVNNDYYVDAACGDNTLTYYARVVTPGTYEAESVYIRSSRDPEISNHSPETTVKITE